LPSFPGRAGAGRARKSFARSSPCNDIEREWVGGGFTINEFEHFYHVGSTEELRNSMTEALVSNLEGAVERKEKRHSSTHRMFDFAD
jgi:hypothetical protein